MQVFNCFATGTTILTPDGERAIETLKPGDRVVTHDGRSTPVIWVARQSTVNPRNLSVGRSPVRIDAGAFGPNLPNRTLTVTGDHALLFDDMLINAGTLINGTSIRLLPFSKMPARFKRCPSVASSASASAGAYRNIRTKASDAKKAIGVFCIGANPSGLLVDGILSV